MGRYFAVTELTRSAVADRLGIDNTPPPSAKVSLLELISGVLDPIRREWGRPLHVNSGYRCPALNKAVGGATNSQHLKGEAADITTGSVEGNRKLFSLIVKMRDEGKVVFDQLIDEKGFSWIHISYSATPRNQILAL